MHKYAVVCRCSGGSSKVGFFAVVLLLQAGVGFVLLQFRKKRAGVHVSSLKTEALADEKVYFFIRSAVLPSALSFYFFNFVFIFLTRHIADKY